MFIIGQPKCTWIQQNTTRLLCYFVCVTKRSSAHWPSIALTGWLERRNALLAHCHCNQYYVHSNGTCYLVQALHSLTSRLRIFSAKSTAGISSNDSRKGGNFLLGVQKQPYRTRKGRTKKPTTDKRVKTTRRIILKPPFNIFTFYVSQNGIIVSKLHLSPLQRWHIEIQSKYSLDSLLLQN